MLFTTDPSNIFRKKRSKPVRKNGHYWVMWSGRYKDPEIWRVGAYVDGVGWKVTGDERLYYDTDFWKINERRIPMNWLFGNPSRVWLYVLAVALVLCWASCILDIIFYIKLITK